MMAMLWKMATMSLALAAGWSQPTLGTASDDEKRCVVTVTPSDARGGAACCQAVAPCFVTCHDGPRNVVRMQMGRGAGACAGGTATCIAVSDGERPRRLMGRFVATTDDEDDDDDEAAAPPVWIGVRLSPLPAPLAAHIGEHGLMIANIVKDSPADEAGLERYDVILKFGGRAIESADDLVKAVVDNGAGEDARIVVLHKSKKREVTIVPRERDNESDVVYKYEEAEPVVEDAVKYFGGTLHLDPGAKKWVFKDLGELKDLPEELEELNIELKAPRFWIGDGPLGHKSEVEVEDGADEPEAGAELHLEVRIKVRDDDQNLEIERGEDGKITVTREAEDGNRTFAVYDNIDELKAKDEDAYRVYQRFSAADRPGWVVMRPELRQIPGLQRGFQQQLRLRLRDIEERLERSRKELDDAQQEYRQTIRKRERAGRDEEPAPSEQRTVTLTIENGEITLVIREDGQTREYHFESWEDFEKSEPELYKEYAPSRH